MKTILCGMFVMVFALTAVLLVTGSIAQAAADGKKAIVITSFGTTFDDSRAANIGSLEERVQREFPEYTVCRAFTSKIIRKKLTDRGIAVNGLEDTLDSLKAQGYTEVILQPTHLTPGEEYTNKILNVAEHYSGSFKTFTIGRPVMMFEGDSESGEPDDFAIVREAIQQEIPALTAGQQVVFMGHGSPHQHNTAYQTLQDSFDAAGLPVSIGVVEESDHPSFADVLARLQAKEDADSVILMPLMLVAGDHAHNDMAGEGPDSWKSMLERTGYQVTTYVQGLGENKAFQDIYIQHIRDAIAGKYSVAVQ